MKVRIWKFGQVDTTVDAPYGATVAEALDVARVSFAGSAVILNGEDASIGDTLHDGDFVSLVPRIGVDRLQQPPSIADTLQAESGLEEDFLAGRISLTTYFRGLRFISRRLEKLARAAAANEATEGPTQDNEKKAA